MDLTLTDLSVLICLLESELDRLHKILQDETASDDAVDDAGELAVQYANTAATLKAQYEALWQEGCNFPTYDELIARH